MTEKEIELISQRVAELVITELMYHTDTFVAPSTANTYLAEEDLLTELAQAMTALDYNLQKENYEKCKELQEKIKKIENKLKNYK